MLKKTKIIYVIGTLIVSVVSMLVVMLTMTASGTVVSSGIKLTFVSGSADFEYDGTEHRFAEWKLLSGELKKGHKAEVTVGGWRTEAGESPNFMSVKIVNEKGADVSATYNIELQSGIIKVKKRPITLASKGAKKEYDGTAISEPTVEITEGSLVEGHTLKATATGSVTEYGSCENKFDATIKAADGTDVTANYEIKKEYGRLEITKKSLTVISGSNEKVYDGKPLTENSKEVKGELKDGHKVVCEFSEGLTDAGEIDNEFTCKVVDGDGNDVTDSYEILCKYGKLKVTKRPISVTASSAEKTYDGEPLRCDEFKIDPSDALLEGHEAVVTIVGSDEVAAGSYDNTIIAVAIKCGDKTVTDNYDITTRDGTLIINKRQLSVTTGSAEKNYDGEPLTNGEMSVSGSFADGEYLDSSETTGTITEPGMVDNTYEIIIKNAEGETVNGNYEISEDMGTLKIVGGTDKETGGKLDSANGGLGGGGGGDENVVVAEVLTNRSDSFLYLRYSSFGDYTGKGWNTAEPHNNGTFYTLGEILKRSGLSTYTATIKSYSNYFLTYYPLQGTDHLFQWSDVEFTGDLTSPYSFDYVMFDYLKDSAKIEEYKKNTIDPNWDNEYADYVRRNYLNVPASTKAELLKIIEREGLSADDIPKLVDYVRNAATYNLDYDLAMDDEDDCVIAFLEKYKEGVCRHYASAGVLLLRTLGIPARYTIGYVGNVKKNEWSEVTGDRGHAWVEMYIKSFGWVILDVTGGSGGPSGGSGGGGSGGSGGGGSGENDGKKTVEVQPVYEEMKYDGRTTLKPCGKVTGFETAEMLGYTYSATITGSQFDVGLSESEIVEFTIFDSSGEDVTDEFSVTYKRGKLHVYAVEITITSETLEKTYDGKPLSSDGLPTIIGSLFVGHELTNVKRLYERREAGVTKNAFEFSITDENGDDASVNYKINYEWGELRVNAKEITITAANASKVYDGTALIADGYEVEGELLEGHVIAEVEIEGEQTEIGKSDNRIKKVVILDENGEDVTKNYAIKCVNGKLVVKK